MRPDAAAAARGLRAGLLLRVSTAAQAQRETPIERQEAETRRWCADRGLEVVERFADPGRSGGLDELSRAGLAALLAAADERRIDAVVMWSWSRLARDEDLAGHLRWMLRRAGVTCYSVSEPEEHPLLRAVGAWRDAEYRREQSRMMRSALARVATAGGRLGRDPYGYHWQDKRTLVPHETQAPIYAEMYQMTLAGALPAEICRRSGLSRSAVHRLLRSRLPLGEYVSRTEGRVITHTDHHPAIVSRDTWEQVQQVLARRASRGVAARGRRAWTEIGYADLLRCGLCGGEMEHRGTYHPAGGGVRRNHRCRSGCDVRISATDAVEQLARLILSELCRDGVAEMVSEIAREAWEQGRESGAIEAEILRLSRAERSITEAIESGDLADPRALARSLGETQRKLSEARSRLARLAAQGQMPDLSPCAIRARLDAAAAAVSLPSAEALGLVRQMVERIDVRPSGPAIATLSTGDLIPLPEMSSSPRRSRRLWQVEWRAA